MQQNPSLVIANIGLDSEFTSMIDPETNELTNVLLSIQAVVEYQGLRSRQIVYPSSRTKRARPTFDRFIRQVIARAMKDGVLPHFPDRINVFAHFLRADLPNFSDFWGQKQSFDGYGRTFTTPSLKLAFGDEVE